MRPWSSVKVKEGVNAGEAGCVRSIKGVEGSDRQVEVALDNGRLVAEPESNLELLAI